MNNRIDMARSASRLRDVAVKVEKLSGELKTVGAELIECGFLQGIEMVGAGEIAGQWAEELTKEAARIAAA